MLKEKKRAKILKYVSWDEHYSCEIDLLEERDEITVEAEALMRTVMSTFDTYVTLNKKIPPEILSIAAGIDEPSRLADTMAAHVTHLKLENRQKILEIEDSVKRLEELYSFTQQEIQILQVEKKIKNTVNSKIKKERKEKYLKEQLRAIAKELGEEHQRILLDESVFEQLVKKVDGLYSRVEELEKNTVISRKIDKDVLTIEQASEFLQVSKDKLLTLLNEEKLPGKKVLDEWRFSKRALLSWLEQSEKKEKNKSE